MGVGTFKNWLLEQGDNAVKQQIIDLLDELSGEEIHEFGEFLYDEFFEFSEENFESEETSEYQEISKEEIIDLLNQLDVSTYEYILDMLQFDEFETNGSELEEGVSRIMKAKNVNKKKRKFFSKGAGTMRKEKSARKKENRANKAARKRYARVNKARIASYQKSRAEKIKSGKHNIKIRRKGV